MHWEKYWESKWQHKSILLPWMQGWERVTASEKSISTTELFFLSLLCLSIFWYWVLFLPASSEAALKTLGWNLRKNDTERLWGLAFPSVGPGSLDSVTSNTIHASFSSCEEKLLGQRLLQYFYGCSALEKCLSQQCFCLCRSSYFLLLSNFQPKERKQWLR